MSRYQVEVEALTWLLLHLKGHTRLQSIKAFWQFKMLDGCGALQLSIPVLQICVINQSRGNFASSITFQQSFSNVITKAQQDGIVLGSGDQHLLAITLISRCNELYAHEVCLRSLRFSISVSLGKLGEFLDGPLPFDN